jgi:hypothetical protein
MGKGIAAMIPETRGKREQEETLNSPVMYHNVEFSLG